MSRERKAAVNALDLGDMEGIELPAAVTLLLRADLGGARQRACECRFNILLACDLTVDVADDPAELGAQEAQFALVALDLLGMGVAPRPSSPCAWRCAGRIAATAPRASSPCN